ncbi:MAG: hypothetical protein UZ08_BCD001002218 [Candidatus Parvibacillus calidus]|jgi:hypothetical protein|nr:MAG: hypothetical protein UZ08_BCD001002218 [Candidatus Parvibacillus calidus]
MYNFFLNVYDDCCCSRFDESYRSGQKLLLEHLNEKPG